MFLSPLVCWSMHVGRMSHLDSSARKSFSLLASSSLIVVCLCFCWVQMNGFLFLDCVICLCFCWVQMNKCSLVSYFLQCGYRSWMLFVVWEGERRCVSLSWNLIKICLFSYAFASCFLLFWFSSFEHCMKTKMWIFKTVYTGSRGPSLRHQYQAWNLGQGMWCRS